MIEAASRGGEAGWFRMVAAGLAALVFFASLYYVFFADSWFDETEFAYKGWLTSEGLATPFLDFGLKHPPVSFYGQVFLQGLFGPSLLAARFLSALFFLGLLLLLFDVVRRNASRSLALFAVALLALNPFIIGKMVSAVPYSMVGFFGMLSVWLLFLPRLRVSFEVTLSSIAMAAAILTRYNVLPLLPLLWFLVLIRTKSWSQFFLSIIASVGALAAFWTPFALIDFEYALSYAAVMLGPFAKLLPLEFFDVGEASSVSGDFLSSVFSESRLKLIMGVFTTYFHLFVLLLFGFIATASLWARETRAFVERYSLLVFSFFATVLLFAAHFVVGPLLHKIYSLYVVPWLVLTVVLFLSVVIEILNARGVWVSLRSTAVSLAVATLLLVPFSVALSGFDIIFFNRIDYADSDLARVKRGGEYLASLTSVGDVILTLDNPDHVLLAGRFMIPERINRHDTYADTEDLAYLERFARYNTDMFVEWLKSDATVFAAQRGTFEARLEPISGGRDLVSEVETILARQYKLAGSVEGVYPLKDRRSDIMDVYRKKGL